ncbi:MAG: hypothetical protein ACOCW6_03415 [Spirochaetota bacterium]
MPEISNSQFRQHINDIVGKVSRAYDLIQEVTGQGLRDARWALRQINTVDVLETRGELDQLDKLIDEMQQILDDE